MYVWSTQPIACHVTNACCFLWLGSYKITATLVVLDALTVIPKTPELMPYQKTIVRAYRSFSGDGSMGDMTPVTEGRQQLQSHWTGDMQVDFTLYNETFTGRGKPIARCKFCLSEHHFSSECA